MKDWTPERILSELREQGTSLRQLSIKSGYSTHTALYSALRNPYPKSERVIATALGKSAEEIWPERYKKRREKYESICGLETA